MSKTGQDISEELLWCGDCHSLAKDLLTPRPRSEWTEEDGDVLWWEFPITEPAWLAVENEAPEACTHWTPCPLPPKELWPK